MSATSTACASHSGLPLSSTSISANSSLFASRRSASFQSSRARWVGGVYRHVSNARAAAATARSTSRSVASGAVASVSPVAGFDRREALVRLDERAVDVEPQRPVEERDLGLRDGWHGPPPCDDRTSLLRRARGPGDRARLVGAARRARAPDRRAGTGRRPAPAWLRRPRARARPEDPRAWRRRSRPARSRAG